MMSCRFDIENGQDKGIDLSLGFRLRLGLWVKLVLERGLGIGLTTLKKKL